MYWLLPAALLGAMAVWSGCAATTTTSATGAEATAPPSVEPTTPEAPVPIGEAEAAKPKEPARPAQPARPAEPSLLPIPAAPEQPAAGGVPDENVVVVETNRGRFVIELYPGDAPQTVANFKKLVQQRFYEGRANTFHRYVPNFVIQGGDPLGRDAQRAGTGGPGYTLPAEIRRKHTQGAVAMARLPDDVNPKKESNGSQFYVCLKDLSQLDGEYTVFGQVIQGMEAVLRLRQNDEMQSVTLRKRSEFVQE
jgi:cyclophilin family peptidyl-prolyl cis-trans isomerase